MKVIIDDREHSLYEKCESILASLSKPSLSILSKEVLQLGDILIKTDDNKPVLLIERKSFSDLLASIKDGRYEEQSYRLTHSSGFPGHSIIYVLEGMFSQLKNPAEKKIIYSAMTSLHMFKGFSVFRTTSIQETAEWIISMADKIDREFSNGRIPYYLSPSFRRPVPDSDVPVLFESNSTVEATTAAPTPAEYCNVIKKAKWSNCPLLYAVVCVSLARWQHGVDGRSEVYVVKNKFLEKILR
jgi:hypothetical protein